MCRKLQKRYDVMTRLVELENVVLVPEELPAPAEIGRSWVRRHDWMLARALLDDSFRDALSTIGEDTQDNERHAARERLYEHLRANILHYQQAIWREEDPQQRSLRYAKAGRTVPLDWRFELEAGAALTIDELRDRLSSPSIAAQFAAYAGGPEARLDQLIDAAAPLGYHGNCAVFRMRPEFGSAELFAMLHFFKSPYLRHDPATGEPAVADPDEVRSSADPDAAQQRNRTRSITLDTNDVIVDVMRDAATASPSADETGAGSHVPDPSEQLVLEGRAEIHLVRTDGHRDGELHALTLRASDDRMSRLQVGEPAEASRGDAPHAILVYSERQSAKLITGVASARRRDRSDERLIVVPSGKPPTLRVLAGSGMARVQERIITGRGGEHLRPAPVAGPAPDRAGNFI